MSNFLDDITRLWWIEVGVELKNPTSEASIKGLKKVLREDLELDNDVITYIVESIANRPSNFSLKVGKSSGIDVGSKQTAVSAQLHPNWEEEDGDIYQTVDLAEEDEEDEKKDGDRPDSGDDKDKAEKDIQKNALTSLEKDKLKKEAIDDKLLKTKLKNPTTGNPNQVSTLLGKKKSDPAAYKVGKDFLGDKGVSDDEIEKQADSSNDDTTKGEQQSNGYVGDKDKSLKQGDPRESDVYQQELPPNDEEFAEKNKKFANPIPPEPYKMPDFLNDNPKFPKKYVKALERMMNTQPKGDATKWGHFSDIQGGAGQISAQAGELMTMMGTTMSDDEWNEFSNSILKHLDEFNKANPKLKDSKHKIVDKTWVIAATKSRKAIKNRLTAQYGEGVEIVASAWDVQSDVEAMGMNNYNENKGFSTDMYLKVRKPNGEEVLDEISLKKSTKVNFLNSGAGEFANWDENLPDEINQTVYRDRARTRNISVVSENKAEIEKLLKSTEGASLNAVLKSKKLTLDAALEGNSRAKQKVLWYAINELAKRGNKSAQSAVDDDKKAHEKFVAESVKAITENDKMREGMLKEIRSEFPLKAVSDGEETMAIGPNSLDKETMKNIFGTYDYDDIKEKLVAEPGPPPFIGYKVDTGDEVIPIANIVIREDGRGYGGQFKFEMSLHDGFAKKLEQAQSDVYGEE